MQPQWAVPPGVSASAVSASLGLPHRHLLRWRLSPRLRMPDAREQLRAATFCLWSMGEGLPLRGYVRDAG